MKVGLYLDEHLSELGAELYAKLFVSGVDVAVSEDRLTQNPDIDGIDVLVFHPPYDNKNGEWDAVSEFMNAHQQTLFYMFALNASERKDYFGNRRNLHYVENGDFFQDPVKLISDSYRDFSET